MDEKMVGKSSGAHAGLPWRGSWTPLLVLRSGVLLETCLLDLED